MKRLSQDAKITRVADGASADTGTTNGTSVDMKDFDSVLFVLAIGSITAGGSVELKAQQSDDDGSSDDWSDLEGTAITYADSDDNGLAVLEITQPRKRYLRPVITRSAQNSVLDGVIALQGNVQQVPVTHDSSVIGSELHMAPAEGTA